MPCTRSMRSKPAVAASPKPEPDIRRPSPLKTRAGRKKKAESAQESDAQVIESPPPSTSKSTKTKTRSKAPANPPPPPSESSSTASATPVKKKKATRSKKKKTTTKKASKATKSTISEDVEIQSVVQEIEEDLVSNDQQQREETPPPPVPVASSSKTKTKAKKGPKGTKKTKPSAKSIPEPIPDDVSTADEDEIEAQRHVKTLSAHQLYKQHFIPLKTALDLAVCDVFPKFMEKATNAEAIKKQEDEFQALMNAPEVLMPPPRPRPKRARSPEATTTKISVPNSFDFAVDHSNTNTQAPAKKKMIMDIPAIPEESSQTSINSKGSSDDSSVSDLVSKEGPKQNEKKRLKAKRKLDDGLLQKDDDDKEEEKPKTTEKKQRKGKAKDKVKKTKETVADPEPQQRKVSDAEMADIFENSVTEINPNDLEEAGAAAPGPEVPTAESVVSVAKASEDNVKKLDGTFVYDTPKEDKKVKELKLNTTYTPELFAEESPLAKVAVKDAAETPKSTNLNLANQTFSKDANTDIDNQDDISTLPIPTPQTLITKPGNAGVIKTNGSGFVSSLVNFFDKNNGETDTKPTPNKINSPSQSTSPATVPESTNAKNMGEANLNATYVLPPSTKEAKTSELNVTVCLNKGNKADKEEKQGAPLFVLPPNSSSRLMNDSAASRTFVKEPPGLAVVEEEDESNPPQLPEKSEKSKLITTKANLKDGKKATSTSSTSSNSSVKSASSQPSLVGSSKKTGLAASKSSGYGSTGKIHEVYKSKPLEEAEKRRQELYKQRTENQKKKMDEWKKKTEKIKLKEEEKKEKQKVVQPPTSGIVLKKPAPILALGAATAGPAGFVKPKFNFGPSVSKGPGGGSSFLPPLSKQPYHSKALPPPPEDLDDSFKTAGANSFLDSTTDGHLSSYDITVYEDLDEDLKHRENKTVPKWASDKEALKVALFSMVLLPDYQYRIQNGFPKPDRSYKLFPPRLH